jgi:uncharacterized membrane protein YedE/YeeE
MTGLTAIDGGAPTRRVAEEQPLVYLALGAFFGVTLVKSEVVSWFRIQEMFRFEAFHMYGIIGSALAVAAASLAVIRRFQIRTIAGDPISLAPKELGRGYRYWIGGTIFGLGWALTGACPGPLFALVGAGVTVVAVSVASAIAGTWAYGYLRPRLPH